MGEQQKGTSLNTLLPKAEVHFHVQDDTAIAALETLRQDWRYKRVEIIHEKGLLDGAINYYAEYEAPSLLIVETDSIDEGFMDKLDKLAANLDEGTAAIIIGPINDVYVYRQLIAMGVSDYLVRPIDPQVLSEVVAKTLVDKIGVSNSRLIAVTGTKGGAGVSTLAQAAALTLSGKEEQKTLLMDAAGGWSYLSVTFGLEPSSTLHEATKAAITNNQEDLKRLQVKVDENLTVLACGGDGLYDDPVSAADFEALINQLMTHHPYVVVDLSAAPAHIARATIQRANKILVVSSPSLPSLRAARQMLKEINDLRSADDKTDVAFILNTQGQDKANEVSSADIESALEAKVSMAIPYDPKIFRALESQGKTLKDAKGLEKLFTTLSALLTTIIDDKSKSSDDSVKGDNSLVGGLLSKIKGG